MALHPNADPALNFELVQCPSYQPLPDGSIRLVSPFLLCERCGNILINDGLLNCPRRQSRIEVSDDADE